MANVYTIRMGHEPSETTAGKLTEFDTFDQAFKAGRKNDKPFTIYRAFNDGDALKLGSWQPGMGWREAKSEDIIETKIVWRD